MQSSNFDKLLDSKPINKLASLVAQSSGVDNIQEIENTHKDLSESISRLTEQLKTGEFKSKRDKDKVGKQRRSFILQRRQLVRQYPFLSKKQKLELTPLILDEAKKLLSKEDWDACVARAKDKLKQAYIDKDLI